MVRYSGRLKKIMAGKQALKPKKAGAGRAPAGQPVLRRRYPGEAKKNRSRLKSLFLKESPRGGVTVREPRKPLPVGAVIGRAVKLAVLGLVGFLVLIVLSVLLVGGYLYLSKSDYFAVRHLKIAGLSHLTRDEVLTAAGLDRPVNNLTFDAQAAVRSLGSLPWVEEARISRTLPDGLLVEVREYKPRALVNLDQLYYLDDRGRAFKKLDPGENPDLPIINGFSLDEIAAGGPLVREALNEVFLLMDILGQRTDEFRLDSISEFNYDPDLGLTLFTRRSGLKLRVGFGSYMEKFRRLGRVMAHLKLNGQAAGLSLIHLETPPRVVLRYSQGGFGLES